MYTSQAPAKIRVAYADDHDIVRKGISELITSLGTCEVIVEANNGAALIEQLDTAEVLPDICLLDIFMPQLDGLQTLVAIRQRWPGMRVLVLTGHNTDYYLIRMIRAGANGYPLKNCSPKELEAALRSIHQNGIYHSEIMTYDFFQAVKRKELALPELSDTEIEFLKYCCTDLSYLQIAEKLGITAKSADYYRSVLFKKLNAGNRTCLAMFAVQFGIVPVQAGTAGIGAAPASQI